MGANCQEGCFSNLDTTQRPVVSRFEFLVPLHQGALGQTETLPSVLQSRQCITLLLIITAWTLSCVVGLGAQTRPSGEMVIAWHVTIAPTWFDPADTPSQVTLYGALHALYNALVRPLPGEQMGHSLTVPGPRAETRWHFRNRERS